MNIFQHLLERLRQLVGSKGWDYCVLWKLSDDQRFIEWMDCCCAGAENIDSGGELQFPVTPVLPCRDVMFQHPKTKSCELLAQLPSCMPLDSGSHAQTLISNQPKWLNFSNNSDSNVLEEIVGTRTLIPVAGGLVELFVAKQVCEDQNVIDYIATLCNISLEQGGMMNSSSMDAHFTELNTQALNELQPKHHLGNEDDQKDPTNHFQQPVSLATTLETLNLPYDISADRIRSCNSPTNSLQHYNYLSEHKTKIDVYVEGSHDAFLPDHKVASPYNDNELQEMDPLNSILTNESILIQGNDKDSIKQENGRSDSMSDCSDQNDDEDDARYQRRPGSKGPQSKNLVAERKRRKKLNERLYALRSLVPKISKLDRASILGDAIEFVKELQNQVKELQDELEEHSDNDGSKKTGLNGIHKNVQSEIFSQNEIAVDPNPEHDKGPNGFPVGGNGSVSKQKQDVEITSDKTQQMEVQVEVAQIDGNQFFVKVFCEHKPGGFVRLMEALDSLGLEVTNANVNSFRGLVSNVFKVEIKDSEMVQADHVRDSLLELTRNPSKGLSEMAKASENNNGIDCNYHKQQQQLQHHLHNHHISSHHRHLHHFQKQLA
ncbi:transcription factor ABORTED MICROSPORES isoform X2 [Herrania umbratica]|nr:transcription factor ABORTED MICROSPORES isoform X2 [Herrania umbratica]XP_021286748.1 transcription factor ABORTED MICROSPORES isoform X2 [Herrania umbratica]XP_021286750.1 transcription factor ABORTED MICROSPORES isoform X2 [Herrania umbratica]XP_021286751.1 transcription factor ABORTED MICROSPORES isoform X2 [Herrania umbratica]